MARNSVKKLSYTGIKQKSMQMSREMIMATAARLFAESSYEGTSLDDIADKIGATKGLIYHYFSSKGVLLGELLLWIHGMFLDRIDPIYRKTHSCPADKLKEVIKVHISFNYENLNMMNVVFRTFNSVPADKRRRIKKQRLDYTERFKALVREVKLSGALVDGDADDLAVSMITLINYLPFHYRDSSISWQHVYQSISHLFCR